MAAFNEINGVGSYAAYSGTRGHYVCADNAANTAVADRSGLAANGTFGGGETTASASVSGPVAWLVSALNLDSNDYIDCPVTSLAAAGTWAARVTLRATPAADVFLFGHRNGVTNSRVYITVDSSRRVVARYANAAAGSVSSSSLSLNVSYSIIATWDGSALNVYVDGTLWATSSNTYSGGWANTVRIGGINVGDVTPRPNVDLANMLFVSSVLGAGDIGEVGAGPEPVYVSGSDTVTGTPQDGETLSVSSDVVYGLPSPFSGGTNGSITYSYQWTASDDGSGTGEANISGATGATFTATSAEVGKYLRRWRRAINTGGFDPAEDLASDFSGVILAAGGGATLFRRGLSRRVGSRGAA